MDFRTELEEAAILNCQSITHPYCDREILMFIKGVKWQQERSYSEGEVLVIIDDLFRQYANSFRIDAKEHFLQFKKE